MKKPSHVPGTIPYFRARGERREFEVDESDGSLKETGVILPERARFEALSLDEVERFCTAVFRQENIVCVIEEISR
jgi:hypothetical protein